MIIYHRVISNVNNVQDNCVIICKNQLLKELHLLVRSLNKIENEPGDSVFGVCKSFIGKTDRLLLPNCGR